MIDMASLKSMTIGASSFHDGYALNMTGNGSDCLSWCRFTAFGIPSPWRLCFQYRKDSCVCELVMLRSVIQRLVKIAVSEFGVESFRGCVNAVFESWLLLQSVTQRPTSITVSVVW